MTYQLPAGFTDATDMFFEPGSGKIAYKRQGDYEHAVIRHDFDNDDEVKLHLNTSRIGAWSKYQMVSGSFDELVKTANQFFENKGKL